jgi:uncharacterized glyoxalase superfamily protein PhnB
MAGFPHSRARAAAAWAELVQMLAGQFHGERSGRVRDPFGYRWSVGHMIEALMPAAIMAG